MGLFDKILGNDENAPFSKQEGMAGILLLMIAADGEISQEELVGFFTTCARMKLFSGVSQSQFNGMLKKISNVLRKQGAEAVLSKAAEPLTPEQKETAFALATDMAFADGSVQPQEKVLLEKIQKQLGVSDALAMKIVEVIMIRNRG